ncbi:hypothetical protein Bca4012_039458 [Brassica carinata]
MEGRREMQKNLDGGGKKTSRGHSGCCAAEARPGMAAGGGKARQSWPLIFLGLKSFFSLFGLVI